MVVTGSRLAAVKYKLAFDRYIKEQGHAGIRSLVAFSGTVEDPEAPGSYYTEVGMNGGVSESELPEAFERDDYRVLLVAEKYQTGFDQPLLQTMYVVKRLAGVQAVQTLSRLNRIAPGKSRTFVLDFANEEEDIYKAFKPYYETTPVRRERRSASPVGAATSPARMDDLHAGRRDRVRRSLVSWQARPLGNRPSRDERRPRCRRSAVPESAERKSERNFAAS